MTIDPQTRLPIPPLQMQVTALNLSIGSWIAGISCVVIAIGFILGLRDWQRNKTLMVILLLVGGGMDSLVEPLVDIIGGCWHPLLGQKTLFEIIGRPMPTWVPTIYAAFYGGLAALVYLVCRKGVGAGLMWALFVGCLIAEPLAEAGMLHWGMYAYYGNQPLWIAGLPPLWWIPANVTAIYLSGLFAVWSERKGASLMPALLMPLASPLIDASVTTLVGFPAIVAVNSPLPVWLTQVCGLVAYAISIAVMRIAIRYFAADSSCVEQTCD